MTEREEAGMEPLLREMLRSEPEIVAWLEPQDFTTTDEAGAAEDR